MRWIDVLAEICDTDLNSDILHILEKSRIADAEFCKVLNKVKNEMYIPRSAHSLDLQLRKLGLTLEDLHVFDRLTDEKSIYDTMKMLYRRSSLIQSEKLRIRTFREFLDLLFQLQLDDQSKAEAVRTSSKLRNSFSTGPGVINAWEAFDMHKELFDRKPKITYGAFAVRVALRKFSESQETVPLDILVGHLQNQVVSRHAPNDALRFFHEEVLPAYCQLNALKELPDKLLSNIIYVMENHLGDMVEFLLSNGAPLEEIADMIRFDEYWNLFYEMYQYRKPVPSSATFKPSFAQLSEDFLRAESFALNVDPEPFLSKWTLQRHGIITRVFGTSGKELEKLRSLLRFFPHPYEESAYSVLRILMPTQECKKWVLEKNLDPESDVSTSEKCGCNCLCSTKLAFLLANEVGMLGTKVHVVTGRGHIYLATGDRVLDWPHKQVEVLETTNRQIIEDKTCTKLLHSLVELNTKGYSQYDTLLPNFAEFYLSSAAQATSTPLQVFIHRYIMERATNLWGVAALLDLQGCTKDQRMVIAIVRLISKEVEKQYTRST